MINISVALGNLEVEAGEELKQRIFFSTLKLFCMILYGEYNILNICQNRGNFTVQRISLTYENF